MLAWLKRAFVRSASGKEAPLPQSAPGSIGAGSQVEASVVERSNLAAYERSLLDRIRTQWQFGDWERLVRLDQKSFRYHPDRAKLALWVAAGHFQTRSMASAKEYLHLARDWGCGKKRISQVLVAGVHNTLGNATALADMQGRALGHFTAAISIGSPGSEARLLAAARANHQAGLLELSQRGFWRSLLRKRDAAGARSYSEEKGQVPFPTAKKACPTLIVIAGMRHSGSTALFNIIRLALEQLGIGFVSGYSEHGNFELSAMASDKLRLVKTHEFRDDIASADALIITARRDLRDSIASATRRGFQLLERLGGPVEYAKYNRTLHDIWAPLSDYEFEYEAYMANPLSVITSLLEFLGLEKARVTTIQSEVERLPNNNYEVTLLSPTHITDPEHKLGFRDTLDQKTLDQINKNHGLWLAKYGYVV